MTHECKLKIVLYNVRQPQFKLNRLYPHCDKSKELIKFFWDERRNCVRRTFKMDEVRQLKKIGFEVEIIGDKYE